MKDEDLITTYEQLTGKKPENRFEEDPDWNYRGSRAEREALRQRVGHIEDDEPPVVIEGQESLLDAL